MCPFGFNASMNSKWHEHHLQNLMIHVSPAWSENVQVEARKFDLLCDRDNMFNVTNWLIWPRVSYSFYINKLPGLNYILKSQTSGPNFKQCLNYFVMTFLKHYHAASLFNMFARHHSTDPLLENVQSSEYSSPT